MTKKDTAQLNMHTCRNLSVIKIFVGLPLSFSTNVSCKYLMIPAKTKIEVR